MRLWSIHPKYLDRIGLVALWREALLAQKVLQNKTKGYKNHPQLERFRNLGNPISAIGKYLFFVHQEANIRKYNFNRNKIVKYEYDSNIFVTKKQIIYEFKHLLKKLADRDKNKYQFLIENSKNNNISANPIFSIIEGEIEPWEKIY